MSFATLAVRHRSTLAVAALAALFLFAGPASAAGLDSANAFLQKVIDILRGAGILVVSLAIIWTGYKILFGGASFREMAPLFIGALFIGGATTFASYLIPA